MAEYDQANISGGNYHAAVKLIKNWGDSDVGDIVMLAS